MTNFDDDLGVHVAMIHRCGSIYISRHMSNLGVGSGQHAFLLAISDMSGSSQEALSRLFGVDKANTARAIRRLENKGYVRREQDPCDGRALRLFLTPGGEACIERIRTVLGEWNRVLMTGVPPHLKGCTHELIVALADTAGAGIG